MIIINGRKVYIKKELIEIFQTRIEEKMQEIHNIDNKYGLMVFRMGLTHLFSVGIDNLTAENVETAVTQIINEGKESTNNAIITPQFQIAILRCAAELSNFSIWELFAYIKYHVITE